MPTSPRLSVSSRLTGALWGAIVAGTGAVGIAVYSGYDLDLGLLVIAVLAAMGLWLVLSALASGLSRPRRTPPEPLTMAAHEAADGADRPGHLS